MAKNAQVEKIRIAFETRPAAEKGILAFVLLAGIVWLYLLLVSGPVKAEIATLNQQILGDQNRIITLQTRAMRAEERSAEDPNRAAREQLERLMAQETRAREQLSTLTGSVVAPLAMNRLLTAVLDLHPDLYLVKVENQTPELISGSGTAAASPQRIFRHGIVLELEGDYLSTLRYMVYLESLSENFYWDSISIVPQEWPRARITLEIHTLSLEESFIGV